MSQENVELARSIIVAFNAGDMDAVRECYDPDVAVGRELEGWPETGPLVGRDAVMRGWEQASEPFGDTVTIAQQQGLISALNIPWALPTARK